MAISFVGSAESQAINGANVTVTLPGGLAQNDIVILLQAAGVPDSVISTADYTELFDLDISSADGTRLMAAWKRMGASPDSTVVTTGGGSTLDGAAVVVMVFRGVHTTTAIDTTTLTAAAGSGSPDSPSITGTSAGTVVISGFGNLSNDTTVTAPSGYGDQVDINSDDTFDNTAGLAWKAVTGGVAEDPGAWTNTNSTFWRACSIVLRESITAHAGATTFGGSGSISIFARLNGQAATYLEGDGTLSTFTNLRQVAAASFSGAGILSVPLISPYFVNAIFPGAGALFISTLRLTFIQPDADSIDGTWTNQDDGTELFSAIDEIIFSDADYIKSGTVLPDTCKISLSDPIGTPDQPFIVYYRYRKAGQGIVGLGIRLLEGTTEIAAWEQENIEDAFITTEHQISGGEFASIVDFNNLFLEFTALESASVAHQGAATFIGTGSTSIESIKFKQAEATFAGAGALSSNIINQAGNDQFTKILLHFDGTDGSTTIIDDNAGGSAHTWSASGNAQLDTGVVKFGTASLQTAVGTDFVTTGDSGDYTLGAGDWTVDFWFNRQGNSGSADFCGQCNFIGSNSSVSIAPQINSSSQIIIDIGQGTSLLSFVGTTAVTDSNWHHYACVRTGDVVKLFLDGTQEGSDHAITGSVNNSTNSFSVGRIGDNTGGNAFVGRIDEFRLSVGIARWTANFTPRAIPYG